MIEIRATRNRPLGMPPTRFLSEYWQKKPLLIRGAFPDFYDPLTPNDLAGLACEELALARLVVHDPRRDRWTLRSGPFAESDFARLPRRDWTVLVQDVDKWDADVAALLSHFDFLPAWRIDDVMVSYAADGGSVGAHVDQYDVFLLQGLGRRRWRISADADAPRDFRDDAELKLLRAFAPTHEWMLERGDMLYLPPGVPHHGVAVGECLTYSIGMRAPSMADLLVDFADAFADALPETSRYADPDLRPAGNDGEIDAAAFARARRAMPWLNVAEDARASAADRPGTVDSAAFRRFFGRFITRYRIAHAAMPRPRQISDAEFARAFARDAEAVRNPWSRAAWMRVAGGAVLFVGGTEHDCSIAFARALSARTPVALSKIRARRDCDALRSLVDLGHVTLRAPRSRSRR